MLLKRSEFKSWLLSLRKDVVVGMFIENEDYEYGIYIHPFAVYLQKISGYEDWSIGGNFYYLYHDGFECNKEIMESWASVFATRVQRNRSEDNDSTVTIVSAGDALRILDEVDKYLVGFELTTKEI